MLAAAFVVAVAAIVVIGCIVVDRLRLVINPVREGGLSPSSRCIQTSLPERERYSYNRDGAEEGTGEAALPLESLSFYLLTDSLLMLAGEAASGTGTSCSVVLLAPISPSFYVSQGRGYSWLRDQRRRYSSSIFSKYRQHTTPFTLASPLNACLSLRTRRFSAGIGENSTLSSPLRRPRGAAFLT